MGDGLFIDSQPSRQCTCGFIFNWPAAPVRLVLFVNAMIFNALLRFERLATSDATVLDSVSGDPAPKLMGLAGEPIGRHVSLKRTRLTAICQAA